MIVADTNLVVYALIPGEWTKAAERVRSKEYIWVVPSLFAHELLNVLTVHVRLGRLERDEAFKLFRRGMSMVRLSHLIVDALSVFNLCNSSGCSSYDVGFVSLAMRLGAPLVTADQQIVRAFPDVATDLTILTAAH